MSSVKYDHHAKYSPQNIDIIFVAFSKRSFYLRSDITAFVLARRAAPVSPFMNFDYNLGGTVAKDLIRVANNTLIARCDELWVFGAISDGVLAEVYLARKLHKPVRYYRETRTESFVETDASQVTLEDVSPWMWDWVLAGKNLEHWHPRLRINRTYPLVYPAYSKHNFFWQLHISQFCLANHRIPLNPFMLFRYFLGDTVPRTAVYAANARIVRLCDELWTFGPISDGVLAEIQIRRTADQPVSYFKIAAEDPVVFRKTSPASAVFEDPSLEPYRHIL